MAHERLNRRAFLTGLICAPVIVRASSLMPVRLFEPAPYAYVFTFEEALTVAARWIAAAVNRQMLEDMTRLNVMLEADGAEFRRRFPPLLEVLKPVSNSSCAT